MNLSELSPYNDTLVAIDSLLEQGCELKLWSHTEAIQDYPGRIRSSLQRAFRRVTSHTRQVTNVGTPSNGWYQKTVRYRADMVHWTIQQSVPSKYPNNNGSEITPRWDVYETQCSGLDVDTEHMFTDIQREFNTENHAIKNITPAYSASPKLVSIHGRRTPLRSSQWDTIEVAAEEG